MEQMRGFVTCSSKYSRPRSALFQASTLARLSRSSSQRLLLIHISVRRGTSPPLTSNAGCRPLKLAFPPFYSLFESEKTLSVPVSSKNDMRAASAVQVCVEV